MRNRFKGTCYRCGETVEKGEGHFERYKGKWRTQHADCAIKYRGTKFGTQSSCFGGENEDETICTSKA